MHASDQLVPGRAEEACHGQSTIVQSARRRQQQFDKKDDSTSDGGKLSCCLILACGATAANTMWGLFANAAAAANSNSVTRQVPCQPDKNDFINCIRKRKGFNYRSRNKCWVSCVKLSMTIFDILHWMTTYSWWEQWHVHIGAKIVIYTVKRGVPQKIVSCLLARRRCFVHDVKRFFMAFDSANGSPLL